MNNATILHIIFCITDNGFELSSNFNKRLTDYLEICCIKESCQLIEAECLVDHLHILIRIRHELSVSQVVQQLKRESQNWVQYQYFKGFTWKAGYSAFSLTSEKIAGVASLIGNQKELHNFISFKDELEIMISDGFENIKY